MNSLWNIKYIRMVSIFLFLLSSESSFSACRSCSAEVSPSSNQYCSVACTPEKKLMIFGAGASCIPLPPFCTAVQPVGNCLQYNTCSGSVGSATSKNPTNGCGCEVGQQCTPYTNGVYIPSAEIPTPSSNRNYPCVQGTPVCMKYAQPKPCATINNCSLAVTSPGAGWTCKTPCTVVSQATTANNCVYNCNTATTAVCEAWEPPAGAGWTTTPCIAECPTNNRNVMLAICRKTNQSVQVKSPPCYNYTQKAAVSSGGITYYQCSAQQIPFFICV